MPSTRIWIACGVLAVAGACGDGDPEETGVASIEDVVTTTAEVDTQPATDEVGADEAAVLEFSACMRRAGIDFPDPVVDADGNVGFDLPALRELTDVDEEDLETAFEQCVSLLEGVSFGFERIFEAEFQDQVLEFAACMRENGFEMPDPDFAALTAAGRLFPEPLDLDDPDFEPAFEACQETLPGIPGIAGS